LDEKVSFCFGAKCACVIVIRAVGAVYHSCCIIITSSHAGLAQARKRPSRNSAPWPGQYYFASYLINMVIDSCPIVDSVLHLTSKQFFSSI
jgi:hypothetical protein